MMRAEHRAMQCAFVLQFKMTHIKKGPCSLLPLRDPLACV